MKNALILIFLVFSSIASATDYYVSATGNDANSGLSSSTPWKTIGKVNSAFSIMIPGDRILFNRGDIFYGTIKVSKSGSAGYPIIIGAYGTGADPIITGFTTLSGWTNEGGNIYSTVIISDAQTNMVTVNGIQVGMGRYPDTTYLIYETFVSNVSITDNGLGDATDWKGAEVAIRKNKWSLQRRTVTDHTGDVITYSGGGWPGRANSGFFFENDLRCVTTTNEWYHNYSTGKLYIYGDPATKTVKIATLNSLFTNASYNYITLDGISFTGSIGNAISNSFGSNLTIKNCSVTFAGQHAIYSSGSYGTINGNSISDCNSCGIYCNGSTSMTITNNTIFNMGLIKGQATIGELSVGISIENSNYLVQYNNISNVGYNGISIGANTINCIVKNNFIHHTHLVLDDGGGIYAPSNQTSLLIDGNIVLNTVGNVEGIAGTSDVRGIYLDAYGQGSTVINNTIANCNGGGIFLHMASLNVVKKNTSFNNLYGMDYENWTSSPTLKENTVTENIFFVKAGTQYALSFSSLIASDINSFGTSDNNYYARPIDDNYVVNTYLPSTGSKKRTLTEWQALTNQDLNSHKSPVTITNVNDIKFEYNASKTDKIVTLSKPMIDVTGKKYQGTITLPPYTSVVLMVDPNPTQSTIPVYLSSVVENISPSILEMTYSLNLNNVIPETTAFTVMVNGTPRSVTSVAISGTKVRLTLSSPVAFGDVVTVVYNKSVTKPLQATSGESAETITAKSVVNNVSPPNPAYVSAVIENTSPSRVDMTYNMTLANVVPAASSFFIKVNSVSRAVSSVSVSGTKVLLTLSSPVANGDIVTVAYTKPATNPIQTAAGGQATSITAPQPVTNNVNPVIPAYVSSVIENATPAKLELTYNLNLANIIPAVSSFSVLVNNVSRNVNSVVISGTKVVLTLASPVAFGDIITIAYSKPATNPLQTSSGGLAATFSAQPVTNNCSTSTQSPPVVVVTYPVNVYSGFVYEIDASGSSDPNNDVLIFNWTVPANVPVSSTSGSKIRFLSPIVTQSEEIIIGLSVSDGTAIQSKNLTINNLPYKPDLALGNVAVVEASNSYMSDIPNNTIDGNLATKWSMDGDNHWLVFDLANPFKISHLQVAFLPDQNFESYFDIYVSKNKVTWEPAIINAKSCDFSGSLQVFDFPVSKTGTEYSSVKLVGHGNSLNTWNYFSEFKLFGTIGENPTNPNSITEDIFMYPNPATDKINLLILEPPPDPQKFRVYDLSGKLRLEEQLDPGINNVQVPLSLNSGVYIAQIMHGKVIRFVRKLIINN